MHSDTIHTHTHTHLARTLTHNGAFNLGNKRAAGINQKQIKRSIRSNDQLCTPTSLTSLPSHCHRLLGHSMLAYLVAFQRAIKLAIDPLIMRNYQLHCGHFTKPANCVNVRLQGDLDSQQQRAISVNGHAVQRNSLKFQAIC